MYLTAEEKPDFLVNEVIQKISNSEWTIEVGKHNVTHIEYYLTSGNNILFMVLKKDLNDIEFRTTYGFNEWEIKFKDNPDQLKLFEED